jgi:hypothetical protein
MEENWGEIKLDGRIILKLPLKMKDVMVWTDLNRFRVGSKWLDFVNTVMNLHVECLDQVSS